jgi:hypothetical protein
MNILITLGVAASSLCVLWAVQSVVLKLVDEPLAWPLRFTTRSPLVRLTCRVMTHVSWLIILVGTPLALGLHPLDVLHQAFPTPIPWRDMAIAFSIVFFPSLIVYALWIKAGWVRIQRGSTEQPVAASSCDVLSDHGSWRRWRRLSFEEFCLNSFFGRFRNHRYTHYWR